MHTPSGQCCEQLYARILSTSFSSVSIFSVCCYSIVSISMVYTLVGPASWMMGTEKLKMCTIGKKLFCTGPTGSAVQFCILPLPSKIHRPNSVSTGKGNDPVNILWIFQVHELAVACWTKLYVTCKQCTEGKRWPN